MAEDERILDYLNYMERILHDSCDSIAWSGEDPRPKCIVVRRKPGESSEIPKGMVSVYGIYDKGYAVEYVRPWTRCERITRALMSPFAPLVRWLTTKMAGHMIGDD